MNKRLPETSIRGLLHPTVHRDRVSRGWAIAL
jgi:hypothetical protein